MTVHTVGASEGIEVPYARATELIGRARGAEGVTITTGHTP